MSARRRTAKVLFLSVSLLASSPAWAQNVAGGFTSWMPASTPPPIPSGGVSGNVTGLSTGMSYWDSFGVVQLQGQATVTTTAPAPPDAFRIVQTREQSFTLSEPAQVALPMFLTGAISFSTTAGLLQGYWDGRLEVINASNVVVGSVSNSGAHFSPMANLTLSDEFTYGEVALPAGAYRVRATLNIAGEAPIALNAPGTSVTVNFMSGTSGGLAGSVAAYPTGLGSSRAAVKAPTARADFGVDGTGIEVGLVEPGNPYTTHSSLTGKISISNGGVVGTYHDEHALAVAGIIASFDGDDSRAGVAPGATIRSSSMSSHTSFAASVAALMTANPSLKVINMSASSGAAGAGGVVNSTVNANPNLTFVKSAGNDGASGLGSITSPGHAYNAITVGAVNRDFTRRATFSSYGVPGGLPMKPDIVAPGEYILAPQARDVNDNSIVDDFGRVFLGDDFRYTISQSGAGADTGRIAGTSFSAPHVAGAAALLYDYQDEHINHEADHRVIKAVLLNSASTKVKRLGGGAWSQATTGTMPGMTVTQSLDVELGAGMLDVYKAMEQYEPEEIRPPDIHIGANYNIPTTLTSSVYAWDLEEIPAGGRVNYLLGDLEGFPLRACLTWDYDATADVLEPLELRLYQEDSGLGNPTGYDPADLLLAGTSGVGENVKLLDLLPLLDFNGGLGYYLQVINHGTGATTYGIAMAVPEPVTLALVLPLCLMARRRLTR